MSFLGAAFWVGPNDKGKLLSSAAVSDRVYHICNVSLPHSYWELVIVHLPWLLVCVGGSPEHLWKMC